MEKLFGSNIQIWEKNSCFKIKIEAMGVIISICKKNQPKTYERINKWFKEIPEVFNPIVFKEDKQK